jgi:hypothetical protein
LRRKQQPVVKLSAPNDTVYALSDIGGAGGWITKGSPVSRDHPHVRNLPSEFEVRYRLDQERSEEVNDGK